MENNKDFTTTEKIELLTIFEKIRLTKHIGHKDIMTDCSNIIGVVPKTDRALNILKNFNDGDEIKISNENKLLKSDMNNFLKDRRVVINECCMGIENIKRIMNVLEITSDSIKFRFLGVLLMWNNDFAFILAPRIESE